MRPPNATLHTGSGQHPLNLRVARHWWQRLRGLMLAPPLRAPWQSTPTQPHAPVCEGLLLMPCNSVHGMALRQSLDIAYLGPQLQHNPPIQPPHARLWRVLRVTQLHPWGMSAHWGSRHTLELPAGAIEALHLKAGDTLELPHG